MTDLDRAVEEALAAWDDPEKCGMWEAMDNLRSALDAPKPHPTDHGCTCSVFDGDHAPECQALDAQAQAAQNEGGDANDPEPFEPVSVAPAPSDSTSDGAAQPWLCPKTGSQHRAGETEHRRVTFCADCHGIVAHRPCLSQPQTVDVAGWLRAYGEREAARVEAITKCVDETGAWIRDTLDAAAAEWERMRGGMR